MPKNLSISISGNGVVADDVAEKVQAAYDALKESGVSSIYTSLSVTDAPAEAKSE